MYKTIAMINNYFLHVQCVKDNITRMNMLQKQKEERSKKRRIEHKKRRAQEQSKR